jgi:23S rRNA (cytidine1920-2'-O)/16S rRNA (cytidine1409-2'-O)-methyltransferase
MARSEQQKDMKKRLDILLVKSRLADNQTQARALIMTGRVSIEDKVVDKPGTLVSEKAEIKIKESFPYVSRGALKLEKAYQEFNLDFKDKIICDIGSSTGGFTDFALQQGAKKVYAIDVGRRQLDQKLRHDKRVIVMEKTDFRDVKKLPDKIDCFLCDVSFISLKQILPQILKLIASSELQKADVVALIKPQFEAEVKEVTQGKGVIKSEQTRLKIVEDIKNFAKKLDSRIVGVTESPIQGAKGNVEYLLYLSLYYIKNVQ